jgi:hypothetical protein
MTGQVHVVVFKENDLAGHLRPARKLKQALDQFLAFIVLGMGLARKDELNRPFFVVDDRLQAIHILQQ